MAKNVFPPKSYVDIHDVPHRYRGHVHARLDLVCMKTGRPYAEPDADGIVGLIDDARFDAMIKSGQAKVRTLNADRTRMLENSSKLTIAQAMAIDPDVERRIVQLDMLDDGNVPQGVKAIESFMKEKWTAELAAEHGPHDKPATLRHWRRVRGRAGARHPRDMIRWNGKVPRGAYRCEFLQDRLAFHIGLGKAGREERKAAYAAFSAELDRINEGLDPDHAKPDVPYKIPHPGTFARWWNLAHDEEITKESLGDEAARQSWRGAGRPLTAEYAMHRVIIDHTRLDVMAVVVLDDGEIVAVGRPWLTLAIDVYSRAVVAHLISFIPPCAWTLGETLRRMVLPKRPPKDEAERWPVLVDLRGKPKEIIVDNAPEFRSHAAERSIRASTIGMRHCPIKRPRYRAIGERAMGTVNRLVSKGVPGCTIPAAEARRVGYDPTKHGLAEIGQIEGLTNLAVTLHNLEPNSDLRNRQPALMFHKDAEARGITNLADLDAVMRDFMTLVPGHQIARSGIEWKGLRFAGNAEVLRLLNDLAGLEPASARRANGDATATVDFVYDPLDISRIHVWNRVARDYVELRCDDADYTDGMPLFVHEMIVESAKASAEAFGSERERIAVRDRLVQAKRHLDPDQSLKQREAAMRLREAPRLRQMAGNVVHLHTAPTQPVSAYDLIPQERAALTKFDMEVLNRRPDPRTDGKHRRSTRTARDAGQAMKPAAGKLAAATAKTQPARRRSVAGGYK